MKKTILSCLLLVAALYGYAQKDTVITRTYRLNGVSSWAHDQIGDMWTGLHLERLEASVCDTGLSLGKSRDTILSVLDTDTSFTIRARMIDNNQWSPDYYSMLWLGRDGVSLSCNNQRARRSNLPPSYRAICITMHFSKHKPTFRKWDNKRITSATLNGKAYVLLDTTAQFEPGRWGGGYDIGGGLSFPYGAAESFVQAGHLANMGFTVSHKKIHFSYRLFYTDSKLPDTLTFDPRWVKGNTFESFSHGLTVGYHLVNKKRFNIIPTASAEFISFSTMQDTVLIDETPYYFSWSAGIAFDIKFHAPNRNAIRYPGSEYVSNYWYLRISSGIRPGNYIHPFGWNGGMYYVSVTMGWYGKGVRRKK